MGNWDILNWLLLFHFWRKSRRLEREVMVDYFVCAASQDLGRALALYEEVRAKSPGCQIELWEMEPDKLGNRYVVICRTKVTGPGLKIKLIKRLKP